MRAHVVLPPALIAEIDELVGRRKRSQFLAEAAEEKLRRQRLLTALDEVAGSLADVDVPGWETPESTSEWVRNLRREADEARLPPGWLPEPVKQAEPS